MYFAYFQGDPHNLGDVQKFLAEMFDSVRPNHTSRSGLCYFMTTADTENVRRVFDEVKDKIIISRIESS